MIATGIEAKEQHCGDRIAITAVILVLTVKKNNPWHPYVSAKEYSCIELCKLTESLCYR